MSTSDHLPTQGADVLSIDDSAVPVVVNALIRNRALSGLVQSIHAEMRSGDEALRTQAELALKKLGFAE